jgi:hypothetical protein
MQGSGDAQARHQQNMSGRGHGGSASFLFLRWLSSHRLSATRRYADGFHALVFHLHVLGDLTIDTGLRPNEAETCTVVSSRRIDITASPPVPTTTRAKAINIFSRLHKHAQVRRSLGCFVVDPIPSSPLLLLADWSARSF